MCPKSCHAQQGEIFFSLARLNSLSLLVIQKYVNISQSSAKSAHAAFLKAVCAVSPKQGEEVSWQQTLLEARHTRSS